jgi:hypothetical protein
MKHSDSSKYTVVLKKLSTQQLDKLMSRVMQEMRRRDSDHVKGDVMASTQALRTLGSPEQGQARDSAG